MRQQPKFVQQGFRSVLRFRRKNEAQVYEMKFDDAQDAHDCLIKNGIVVIATPTGKDRHGRPIITHEDFELAAKNCGFDWHEFSLIPINPRWGY